MNILAFKQELPDAMLDAFKRFGLVTYGSSTSEINSGANMNSSSNKEPFQSLPITSDLTTAYALSLVVAFLMTAVSIGGLLFPPVIYPTEELRQSYLANDVVNLLVGLPILLGSMWLSRRGKLIGLLCWPGALLYTFYNYIAYVFGIPFSWFTLGFVLLVFLSAYPVFALLKNVDRDALKIQLTGSVSEKLSGGALVFFGLAFFFLAVSVITEAGADQTTSMTDVSVAIADIVLSMLLFVGGILLFRRHPLGYANGLGLLFATNTLFIGVILIVLFQPLLTDAPFVLEDVMVLSAMALISFIPTGLFVRGVLSKGE